MYDKTNSEVPLVEQMLKFWQFEPDEYKDSQPDMYWSAEEKKLGDAIIKEHVGDSEFGVLLISGRYDFTEDNIISRFLRDNPLPCFYWTSET